MVSARRAECGTMDKRCYRLRDRANISILIDAHGNVAFSIGQHKLHEIAVANEDGLEASTVDVAALRQ